MTGPFCTGWDRSSRNEWAHLPNLIQRWLMIRRLRKEMRGL